MNVWTEERVELLRKLAEEKRSARAIAEELKMTRNAVIGKAERMGFPLTGYAERPARPKKPPRPVVRLPKINRGIRWGQSSLDGPTPPTALPLPEIRAETNVSFDDFHPSVHCGWVISPDGEPTMYCGGARIAGKPYCAGHCELAYTGIPVRKPRTKNYG